MTSKYIIKEKLVDVRYDDVGQIEKFDYLIDKNSTIFIRSHTHPYYSFCMLNYGFKYGLHYSKQTKIGKYYNTFI